jgi:hypothetical protein
MGQKSIQILQNAYYFCPTLGQFYIEEHVKGKPDRSSIC